MGRREFEELLKTVPDAMIFSFNGKETVFTGETTPDQEYGGVKHVTKPLDNGVLAELLTNGIVVPWKHTHPTSAIKRYFSADLKQ